MTKPPNPQERLVEAALRLADATIEEPTPDMSEEEKAEVLARHDAAGRKLRALAAHFAPPGPPNS